LSTTYEAVLRTATTLTSQKDLGNGTAGKDTFSKTGDVCIITLKSKAQLTIGEQKELDKLKAECVRLDNDVKHAKNKKYPWRVDFHLSRVDFLISLF
jgi:hypothetical protein